MKTPMGDREVTVDLTEDGDTLTGTATGDGNTDDIADGKIEGGHAKFNLSITVPMPLTLEFDLEADGSNMTGNVKLGMFGNAPVTGTKA